MLTVCALLLSYSDPAVHKEIHMARWLERGWANHVAGNLERSNLRTSEFDGKIKVEAGYAGLRRPLHLPAVSGRSIAADRKYLRG